MGGSTTGPYPSAWSNGFFGVSLEALDSSTSPTPIEPVCEREPKHDEKVLHSIFSPSPSNKLYRRTGSQILSTTKETPLKCSTADNDSDSSSDVFWSPAQFTTTASLEPATPFSTWTNNSGKTNSSFRSLPSIQMLSADFIQSHANIDQLRHIIEVLKVEEDCPSLLKLARGRLSELLQGRKSRDMTKQEDTPQSSSSKDNGNTCLSIQSSRQSSLVYSDDDTQSNQMPILQLPSYQSRKHSAPTRSEREQELSKEVQRLTHIILELGEEQRKEQKAFLDRLQALKTSRDAVQAQVQRLEDKVASSAEEKQEIIESLESLQEENRTLSGQLQVERAALEKLKWQSKEIENELNKKVQELKVELENSKSQGQSALLAQQGNAELNQLMGVVQKNLDDVSMENTVMLRTMLMALGEKMPPGNKRMSREERRRMIADLAKKTASSTYALDAMARSLKQSEFDLEIETRRRRTADALLGEAVAERGMLEKENFDLSVRLQTVLKELEKSRAEFSSMLQSTHQQHEEGWGVRESQLNNIIRGLRKQLREESSLVRMCRVEMQKRKQLEKELENMKKTIQTGKMGEKEETATTAEAPRDTLSCENFDVKPTTPHSVGNKENSTPSLVKSDSSTKSSEKTQRRIDMRRAAGGRKALQEKMKQIRSPCATV